jgi:hypothetical protein
MKSRNEERKREEDQKEKDYFEQIDGQEGEKESQEYEENYAVWKNRKKSRGRNRMRKINRKVEDEEGE